MPVKHDGGKHQSKHAGLCTPEQECQNRKECGDYNSAHRKVAGGKDDEHPDGIGDQSEERGIQEDAHACCGDTLSATEAVPERPVVTDCASEDRIQPEDRSTLREQEHCDEDSGNRLQKVA